MSGRSIPEEHYLFVAAIDIGTTYSGYAFASRNDFLMDQPNIKFTTWIGPSGALALWKTPTALLLNEDRSFNSFGFEAECAYTTLMENNEYNGYYFRRFKLELLDRNKRLTRKTILKDVTGTKVLPAIEVFAHSIQYFKDHLLTTLKTSGMKTYQGDIQWVLTVPAIWDDPAKQFMREAAEKAGIHGGHLKIVLEPEAASICCQASPSGKLEGTGSLGVRCLSQGSRYLVLDAGGGIVDTTVHEIQPNGSLLELGIASGGPWGGICVDQMFKEMLEDVFGKEVLEEFSLKNYLEYKDLLTEFEIRKRKISQDPPISVRINIPCALIDILEDKNDGGIRQAIMESIYKDSVTFLMNKVRITNECFCSLFKKPIDSIVEHVRKLLNSPRGKGTKTIMMVGGFSESPLLQKALQNEFPECRFIIPQYADLCVLKGAVMFGYRPKTIIGRVAKCTYGIGTTVPFKHGKHRHEKLFKAEGIDRCNDIFSKHVTLGDELKNDDIQSESNYYPLYKNQKSISLPIFTSSEYEPCYTDDYGCKKLGELNITLNNPEKGSDGVKCCMIFGETELRVVAEEKSTGQKAEAKFDFLCAQ